MRLLSKIRLSLYIPILFVFFLIIITYTPKINLLISYIGLFSASIILLGFYLNPLLIANKNRIEELAYLISLEAAVFYKIDLELEENNDPHRKEVIRLSKIYLNKKINSKDSKKSDDEYFELINYCRKNNKDKFLYNILIHLSENNQNRARIALQLRNKVYTSEWLVMVLLYSVAIGFIFLLKLPPNSLATNCIASLLATAISFALLFLWKLSNLTHKKAAGIWQPFIDLDKSNFNSVDF